MKKAHKQVGEDYKAVSLNDVVETSVNTRKFNIENGI